MPTEYAQTLNVGLTAEETCALRTLLEAPMAQLDPSRATFDLKTACNYYQSVKGLLPIIKGVVAKIPAYGDKISTLLGYLEMIADFSCPAPQSAPIAAGMYGASAGPRLASALTVTRLMNIIPAPLAAQTTDFTKATITNGYGQIAKAGATVTKGATVDIDVRINVNTVAQSDFDSWLSETKNTMTTEQKHVLEENHAAGGFMGGALAGCFGIIFGAGTYNHYKNETNSTVNATDNVQQGFLKSVHNLRTQNVTVTGKIHVVGQGYIPSTAEVYVETTKVTFNDGTEISVIDTGSPAIADASGNTSNFQGSGQLHVV